MTQAQQPDTDPAASVVPGLPRKALTPQQQLDALRKVQTQADQRVKLGMQLFKATETRLANQSDILKQVRTQHDELREQVQEDVAKSLQSYDQWIGKIDENFNRQMHALEQKVDDLAADWQTMRRQLAEMIQQGRQLLTGNGVPMTSSDGTGGTGVAVGTASTQIQEAASILTSSMKPAPDDSDPTSQPSDTPCDIDDAAAVDVESLDTMQAKIPEPLTMDMNHPANLTMPTPPPTVAEASDAPDEAASSDDQSPATDADDRIYSQILDKLRRDDADKKAG